MNEDRLRFLIRTELDEWAMLRGIADPFPAHPPPTDRAAEERLIGAILHGTPPSRFAPLTARAFFYPLHAVIWTEADSLARAGARVTPDAVWHRLKSRPGVKGATGDLASAVLDLWELPNLATAGELAADAAALLELADLRALLAELLALNVEIRTRRADYRAAARRIETLAKQAKRRAFAQRAQGADPLPETPAEALEVELSALLVELRSGQTDASRAAGRLEMLARDTRARERDRGPAGVPAPVK